MICSCGMPWPASISAIACSIFALRRMRYAICSHVTLSGIASIIASASDFTFPITHLQRHYNPSESRSSTSLSRSSFGPCGLPSWRLGIPTDMPTASRPSLTSSRSRSRTAAVSASPTSPPKSLLRSIFKPPTTPVSAPAMAADLYSGKMIACCGQTRLHAGQPFLHWSWFSVMIRSSESTP